MGEIITLIGCAIAKMITEVTKYNNGKQKVIINMRKTRSDCRVGSFEKKHGLPPGTIRNKNGRDTRSNKTIRALRKEYEKSRNNKK